MNTYCKARWTDQWPAGSLHVQQSASPVDDETASNLAALSIADHVGVQDQTHDADAEDEDDDAEDDDDDTRLQMQQHQQQQNLVAFDHQQLQQHLQQELSLQHLQLFNQLQVRIL